MKKRPAPFFCCSIAIALIAMLWPGAHSAIAQSNSAPSERALLDELHQGLKVACNRKPILIRYHLNEFNSAEYLQATSKFKEASDVITDNTPSAFKDMETEVEVEFALKGNKQAYRKSGQGIWQTKEGAAVVDMRRTAAFNGTLAISTDYQRDQFNPVATVYVISRDASLVKKPALPSFLSFQEILLQQLELLQTNGNKVKLRVVDDQANAPLQLVFTYSDDERCSYWLDRKHKFAIIRCEHIQSKTTRTESSTKYHEVDGLPFPSEVKWVQYMDSDKPAWRQNYRLQSLEVDAANIPDSMFEIDVPAGSAVYDKDARTWQR